MVWEVWRVWESLGEFGRVWEGLGAFGRVWEGLGGTVWEGGSVKEGLGWFGKVWESGRGSEVWGGLGRVSDGLGWFGRVWEGLGGLGGTRRHPSATPGFAQRWMSKLDTHHGALWRCDRLPPDTLQMSPKPIFGETGVQFARLSLEGICCMRVPRRSRAFTSTQGRSQAPTSVRRHSQEAL